MEALSSEILLIILSHFSQKYAITICSTVSKRWNQLIFLSPFYTNIHIYSEKQLKTFIEFAKEKEINGRYISHQVRHLIFHYYYRPLNPEKYTLSIFRNLHTVDGLDNYDTSIDKYESIYGGIVCPTVFCYISNSKTLVKKFNNIKHHLKSLFIILKLESTDIRTNNLYTQNQLENIYMEHKGGITKIDKPELNIKLQVLRLPTTSLKNLTELKLNFQPLVPVNRFSLSYITLNESTFENIHQCCPLLESLRAERFHMDLSDEYFNNTIIPVYRVKNIRIISTFHHHHCFSYLSTKYPNLESLHLTMKYQYLSEEEVILFQDEALSMLHQLRLLKKLYYTNFNADHIEAWPNIRFMKWLSQNPKQLNLLSYSFPFTTYESRSMDDFQTIDEESLLSSAPKQFDFLNHLTSLSLRVDGAVQLAINFLIQNTNSNIISATLEELKLVQRYEATTQFIYIYDWLELFPNLSLFKIKHRGHIMDNSQFTKDSFDNSDAIETTGNREDCISNKLHQLIKKRKQIHGYFNNDDQDQTIYKLKHLDISTEKIWFTGRCNIWFKNGFNDLLKKCDQLKSLTLSNITFMHRKYDTNGIYLDLSHLHLELLKVYKLSFAPIRFFKNSNRLTKIIVYETIKNSRRVIELQHRSRSQGQLVLACKFIDGLVHDKDVYSVK